MNKPHPNLIGTIVNWFPHAERNSGPQAALVTAQRGSALTLAVYRPNATSPTTYPGVLHVDNPQFKQPGMADNAVSNGGWDYTPHAKALDARLAELTAQVQELTDALTLSK